MPFIGMMGKGVVQSSATEPGRVLIVGAGTTADRGALWKGLLQFGQGHHHPFGHGALCDRFAQVSQGQNALFSIRLELGASNHLFHMEVEAVVLHEFVVEIEGKANSIRNEVFRESESAQSGKIGGLYAKGVAFGEFDVGKRAECGDRQIPLGVLGGGRSSIGVVRFHFFP